MMVVCPLVFEPIFKPKIWGGRRLATLGKKLPEGEPIGESWELADLEDDQSVVREGPAKGERLGALVTSWGRELVGGAELFEGRFPLLIKFLDAKENLSVQVHPDAKMAARLGGRVRIKNEAWYVLDVAPGGAIYRGLKEGVTREAFVQAIEAGTTAELLRRIEVKVGECYYLPSGTVHALGGGVVVAEVQTPSDVTYRVFDWNRVDPATGKGRALHITEALECIDFSGEGLVEPPRQHVASVWATVTRLVACESFIIERVRMIEGIDQAIPTGELIVWIVLEGSGEILYDRGGRGQAFERGDTVLIPAGLGEARIRTRSECVWLEVTLPLESELKDYPRLDRASLAGGGAERYVQLNEPRRDEA